MWIKTLLVIAVLGCAGLGVGLATIVQERDEWFTLAELRATEISKAQEDARLASQKLTQSEADVKTLETRVAQLANEKARAQDDAAQAAVNTNALLKVTQAAARVTELTTSCMDYQDQWSDILVKVGSGLYTYNRYQIDSFISDMARTCGQAEASADALQSLVRSL